MDERKERFATFIMEGIILAGIVIAAILILF
jgi:hypothetical protein